MDGGNVNMLAVQAKQKSRKDKINSYMEKNKVSRLDAAMFIDNNGPPTTNRKMLHKVGYDVSEITSENYLNVIEAFRAINVVVLSANHPVERIVSTLNRAIDETITECWGGEDMTEYLEIF